eukprot:Gb_23842 [translate_table: standard]
MAIKAKAIVFVAICVGWVLLLNFPQADAAGHSKRVFRRRNTAPPKPKETLSFYFHDILYNGHNGRNATSAIVGAPKGANLTSLTGNMHFGDMVVFDDPITLEPRLHARQIGRAQGFYFYDQKKRFSAWLGFTAVLDSREYNGTLTFAGADPIYVKKRDIVVVGGTGDFFLARGIANVQTHAFEGDVYFRLFLNVSLY